MGIGKFEDFLDQLEEIAGDNVYTAHNFNELSDLFDEMVVETCSKYSLSKLSRLIHFIATHKSEIRPDILYIINI